LPASANVGYQNRTDIVFDMTTDAVAAVETFSRTVTRAFRVVGVTVIAKVNSAGSTVDVKKGASTIAAAVPCAVANAVSAENSLASDATAVFAVGDTLNVSINVPGVGARGTIIVETVPVLFGNQTVVTAT
jgi:hypothetical protein